MPAVFACADMSCQSIDRLIVNQKERSTCLALFIYALQDHFFDNFDRVATPIKLKNIPLTDAPHEKKFRKNVDSIKWMTIKKGRITPRDIRTKPRLRRRRGLFISSPSC